MTMPKTKFTAPALTAACILGSVGVAFAGTNPPIPLRVVTQNLKDGIGAPGSLAAQTFGKYLTTLDIDGAGPNTGLVPDVVMFQEVELANRPITDIFNFVATYLPGYSVHTANGDGFNCNTTAVRPGVTIVSSVSLSVGGPRGIVKTRIRVPGTIRDTILYNAHYKCCGDASSQNQRRNEANSSGNNVSFEINFGNANVIFGGDLNSNNNSDGTITGLFFTQTTPTVISSGILNLPVETLNGRLSGSTILTTFPGSNSRLDYICLDNELAGFFDTPPLGSYTQTEYNTMGFVYYSNEDNGALSNGQNNATNIYSDHRPVVFDVLLPRDPASTVYDPRDVNKSGVIDTEDLYIWESAFALGAPPQPNPAADVDGNRNKDLNDRALIKSFVRLGEFADITTQ